MQLIILGMHRSGTSMVTRLVNMMGAYFGPEGVSLGANDENPKGFWERRDVLDLDEALLHAAGADWIRVADFDLDKIPPSTVDSFRTQAAKLILELDAHRPWVMKEPRQCLLFPLWRELLEIPVCIFVHRQPIQVAQSLQKRNGFPIHLGLALWERYTLDALRTMVGLPVVLVLHEDLMRNPIAVANRLLRELRAFGVRGLRQPSTKEILSFIDPKLFRHKGDQDLQLHFINHRQKVLDDSIRTNFNILLSPTADLTISAGGNAQLIAYCRYLDILQSLEKKDTEIENLHGQLTSQSESLRSTEQSLAERESSRADLADRLHHVEQYLSDISAKLEERERDFLDTTALLEDRERSLADLSERLFHIQQDLSNTSAKLEERERAFLDTTTLLDDRECSLAGLIERCKDLEQALFDRTTELELRSQDYLTQREAVHLAERKENELTKRVEDFQAQVIRHEEYLDYYRELINQAVLDIEAVRASARWRIGNMLIRFLEGLMFRGRPPLVLDELHGRFQRTRMWGEAIKETTGNPLSPEQAELTALREWLGLLDADFQALMRSMRWRVGHALVRPIEISLGRGKPILAADLLRGLHTQIRCWSPSGDTEQDISQCEIWFAQIDQHLKNLLDSKRWQLGNAVICSIERLLGRTPPKLAVDHMREVLGNYAAWRERHPMGGNEDQAMARFDVLALECQPVSRFARQIDIIIPIYNALPDVKRCLTALRNHDDGSIAKIILVNDGSGQETTDWLRSFRDNNDGVQLIEHPVNHGYTHAVNTGLAVSAAPYLLLLNSDTIVTRGWLGGLLACLTSNPRIGIVGPLSNAATWQSVPELYDDRQHFAHNALPPGLSPDDMALVIAHAATRSYPQTPFVNGFCFLLKRDLMASIGVMDAEHFPQGYGEENDYCIRATDAGFTLRIADDVYVYHAQSKSFGHERREALSAIGFQALEKKHGSRRFHDLVERAKDTSRLDRVRARIRHSLQLYHRWQALRVQALQGVDTQPYLPRHLASPSIPSMDIPLHILIYSDQPGPDLRLTLEALAPDTLPPTRYLHLVADWSAVERRFHHETKFSGRFHHFEDERGFYAAIKSVMDDIGPAHYCIIRQGVIVLPNVIDALLAACVSPSGYAAASPITNRLSGLALPLATGGNPISTNGKVALSHGESLGVATPMLDLDIFLLSRQALTSVPFPGFVNDKTEQSLVRFFLALSNRGLALGILLSRYAFRVASGPFARPRTSDQLAALAEPVDREPLLARLSAFRRNLAPWHLSLQQSQPVVTAPETVCVVMSTLHLYGGVIVLVNWINQLILSGVDVRVFVLHYDGAPAAGLRVLFEPRPLTDTASIAAELPRSTRIVATLWSTVSLVEDLVSRVPAARGYYFIQDYETLFYRDNPAERAERVAAEASYCSPLRKVVTSRWIAEQLPDGARSGLASLTLIPVGIDHAIFPPTARQPRDSDAPPVILAMARPETPRRGFKLLIAGLSRVKALQPQVRIHLFGSPTLSQHPIPFSYVDLGTVATDRLRQLYADADIFVDSSDFQGFGLCPLEAMALGCGCVLTDSGGIREYAEHEVNALIVPHDAQAMATAIEQLITDPALRQRLATAGVRTAQAFDYSRTTAEWRRLFDQETTPNQAATNDPPPYGPGAVVVIPIYNQMHAARLCIDSVLRYLPDGHEVLLVDDGSDSYTADQLAAYAQSHARVSYLRNDSNVGFVQTASRGMNWAGDRGKDIILLNSDTIVVAGWIERLVSAAYAAPEIGVVSPLATTSPHLGLTLTPGASFMTADAWLRDNVHPTYPTIITPEGWCFFIKHGVYQRLGGFDPIFGRGYCEESDYCMRAIAAGFRLAACENLLIHHQGKVTFGAEQGTRYTENRKVFDARWLPIYKRLYQEFITLDPLHRVRSDYQQAHPVTSLPQTGAHAELIDDLLSDPATDSAVQQFEQRPQGTDTPSLPERPAVTFLLARFTTPLFDRSLILQVNALVLEGLNVSLVVLEGTPSDCPPDLLTHPYFMNWRQVLDHPPPTDLMMATDWTTCYLAVRLGVRYPALVVGSFVREFEADTPEARRRGLQEKISRTYSWPCLRFAESEAVCQAVRAVGGSITRIAPPLEADRFYPRDPSPADSHQPPVLLVNLENCAGDPSAVNSATEACRRLKAAQPDLRIRVIGDTLVAGVRDWIDDPLGNPNGLNPSNALRSATVLLDTSSARGFNRWVAEAFASGLACVLTVSGGTAELARDRDNCLLTDPGDIDGLCTALRQLLNDKGLNQALGKSARHTMQALTPADHPLGWSWH